MKSHELARHFDLFAKLLRSLPDSEIDEAMTILLALVGGQKLELTKVVHRASTRLPEGIEDRLRRMTPAEIESYLDSETDSYSTSQLVELAERLGVTTSKRQSRSALVNLITRYFEAGQMDSIIRTARKDET